MHLAPYLYFDGDCKEALQFYAQALGGSVVAQHRWADAPNAADLPAEQLNGIMHATFEATGVTFMAADMREPAGAMCRVSLSLAMESVDVGARVFAALASGGTVMAPFAKQFWGATFGQVIDRFGIRWMINAG